MAQWHYAVWPAGLFSDSDSVLHVENGVRIFPETSEAVEKNGRSHLNYREHLLSCDGIAYDAWANGVYKIPLV